MNLHRAGQADWNGFKLDRMPHSAGVHHAWL